MRSMEVVPLKGGPRVKRSYEKAWRQTRDRIAEEIASGDSLASILARMGRMRVDGHMESFWRHEPSVAAVGMRVMEAYGVSTQAEGNPYYPAVVNGRFTVNSSFNAVRYLYNSLRSETNIVIEFGSGWSANLFQLYVLVGNRRSEAMTYVGAEYTKAGAECGSILARHDASINYRAVGFDWTNPDLGFLADLPGPRHVLAFSHHSIEQVEKINPDFYRLLAEGSDTARIVHIEPVGWQRDQELLARRQAGDTEYFARLQQDLGVQPSVFHVPRPHSSFDATDVQWQLRAAAWWSWSRSYNTNLLEVVDSLRDERLGLRQVLFDFDSLRNPLNTSSLIAADLIRD